MRNRVNFKIFLRRFYEEDGFLGFILVVRVFAGCVFRDGVWGWLRGVERRVGEYSMRILELYDVDVRMGFLEKLYMYFRRNVVLVEFMLIKSVSRNS